MALTPVRVDLSSTLRLLPSGVLARRAVQAARAKIPTS
jgi:hypothetical protein